MNWTKKGLIYCANGISGWAVSHAAAPTPYYLNDKTLRIFCAFCDAKQVSRVGYVDVQADNPQKIIGISANPLLNIGNLCAFDENGVIPTSIVYHQDTLYLYYFGFQLGVNHTYSLYSGLAISHDNGNHFTRYNQKPLLDRSDKERFLRSAPCVIKEGNLWKMWYVAGDDWLEHDRKMLPVYTIKYLESSDGLDWGKEGITCLILQGDEYGFGRPYVVKDKEIYKLFYSIRSLSKGYRLGYAESLDGKIWVRKDDKMILNISPHGWDSQAVCYSATIKHGEKTYLFYNGNGYGTTGFGYAELDGQ
jgi:hypothetical protein